MCSHSYSQLLVLVLFGVIVGAIYYKVKRDDKGIQNRSVLFFVLCFSLLPRLFNASALQAQDPSGACFFDQSLQTLTEFNDVMGKESRYVRHRVQNRFYVIIAVISGIIAIIWNPPLSVQWRRVLCLESNLTYVTNWLALGKMLKTLHKSLWFFVVFCFIVVVVVVIDC